MTLYRRRVVKQHSNGKETELKRLVWIREFHVSNKTGASIIFVKFLCVFPQSFEANARVVLWNRPRALTI